MDEKIRSISSQLDELNKLCAEAVGDESGLDDEDYRPDPKQLRLGVMILKMLDGELEGRYVHRLGKWLCADGEARRYYFDFIFVCAGLRYVYNKTNQLSAAMPAG